MLKLDKSRFSFPTPVDTQASNICWFVKQNNVTWNQINIMKNEALPVFVLECLFEADIHEHGPIELFFGSQLNDVDGKLELLLLQKRHHVIEKDVKVFLPVAEWDDNGDAMSGETRLRRRKSA